jgi:CheY-like chemotaxis protein
MSPRVLWVDDWVGSPNEARLLHAGPEIARAGWTLSWAKDILQAATLLHDVPFSALILDQMIPGHGIERRSEEWAAYRILCWLRGTPPSGMTHEEPAWRLLELLSPAPVNQLIPVILVSAYHDPVVRRRLDDANANGELRLLPKPVDTDRLIEFLTGLGGQEGP